MVDLGLRDWMASGELLFLHHQLNGSFELSVVTIEEVFGCVVHFDVGVELGIFSIASAHIAASHLRNTEDHTIVDECFPPYGSHRAGYGSTDEFADSQLFVDEGEAVSVAVIVFANEHARGFHPFVEGVAANEFASWNELLVLFAAEQGAEVIMQPTSSVVTFVNNNGIFVAVLVGEELAINGAEALAVHRFHVYIGYTSAGETVYHLAVAVYPSLVEKFLLGIFGDGFNGHVEAFLG